MASTGKILVRIVFVACMVLILLSDYTGLFGKIMGGKGDTSSSSSSRIPPRPANPGYGDVKTEIDLDADIEDESIKNFGIPLISLLNRGVFTKNSQLISHKY